MELVWNWVWNWYGTGMELDPAQPGLARPSSARPGPAQLGLAARPGLAQPGLPGPTQPGPAAQPGTAKPGLSWHGRSASPRLAKLPGQARPARPGLANSGLSWHARSASPRPAKWVGLGWTSLSWSRRSKACARSRYYTTTRRTRCEACKATPNILNLRSGVCEINAHPRSIEARMQPRAPHFNVVSLSSGRVVARAK